MDFFSAGLGLACLSFVLGFAWRVHGRPGSRLPAASEQDRRKSGLAAGLVDIILLRRTLRTGKLRWAGHTLLILGFLPLLFLHAMDGIVTRPLFSGYEPTLEPWQSARNALGLAALAGLGLLVWHRGRRLRAFSRVQDWALLGLLAAVLLTGFVLEAAKMASPADFERMVADFFPEADGDEFIALQAHWARENGVRFERFLPTAPEILEQGRELHEDRCAGCHAPTATAFASRTLADALPAGAVLPRTMAPIFWHLHVGLAFLVLALLPWGKFLHPLASPANLLVRGGRWDSGFPAAPPARNLALEACTRCGQCSLHCSVAPSRRVLGNVDILPMDKLADLRSWLDRSLDGARLADLVEGSHVCTECLRCTQVCPAGIDLQDLWISSKAALSEAGRAGVDGEIRKRTAGEWAHELASRRLGKVGASGSGLADHAESFWGCVQCTTCTGVCPVVAVSTDPQRDLDLTPQQIMNYLRMGLKAQTLGARMVWSCTTCYKCQEHCPQGVPVADILYELRQLGARTLRHRGKP
ncbi:4Fe-4S dicluster domain-containing protein [Desulfomicrobium escambiense]|uniref:4Fe-4S dicluster domain-containing protein n=1 Tax=Desulfomicrobium escambiense TaxID=29503 RepID=UPI0003F9387E|nr:4Fe-4S dicluster domain-containing protein [Desulfomicrobium escambiense]